MGKPIREGSRTAGELSASLEDYLEAIYHIANEQQVARSRDIAKRLGVNSSSVTGALQALAGRDLIRYAPYDLVSLTPDGILAAEAVVRRHKALCDFLTRVLGIDIERADEAACRMEHALPADILERLRLYLEYLEAHPRLVPEWREGNGFRAADS